MKSSANKTFLFVTAVVIFNSGCATSSRNVSSGDDRTYSGSVGYAAGFGTAQSMSSNASVGAIMTASTFVLTKYEASESQRLIAQNRAHSAYLAMSDEKKNSFKSKKRRYIAVETKRDSRSKGVKSVMLWDTRSQEVVGNNVYDVDSVPQRGSTAQFETFTAEYVGTGS